MAISHDRLFKELLRVFLWEFLELFIPGLTPHLVREPVELKEPQLFTDVTSGETHEVDLVAQMKLRGQETCLLIHVEAQAQSVPEFERRMFRYFARLHESYGLPVVPIALLSDRAVQRKEGSGRYQVQSPDLLVLDFRFYRIELKRYAWRDFLQCENPVAGALMSRMRIARRERPLVKSACLRLIARQPLDPARRRLLSGFVDTYLNLDEKENARFMLEISQLEAKEAEEIMELTTSWKEEGRVEGRVEGRAEGRAEGRLEGLREGLEEGLALALQARFGERAAAVTGRLKAFDEEALAGLKAIVLSASWKQVEDLLLGDHGAHH